MTKSERMPLPLSRSDSNRIAPRWVWILLIGVACGMGAFKFHLMSKRFDADRFTKEATAKAIKVLDQLPAGFSATDLVSALNIGVVNFSTNSSDLPADSFPFLDSSATAIKKAPGGVILEIEGHADSTGEESHNQDLSINRARSVAFYLVKKGVNPRMVVAKGFGSSRPVASNDTEEGRFNNRRIEYRIR